MSERFFDVKVTTAWAVLPSTSTLSTVPSKPANTALINSSELMPSICSVDSGSTADRSPMASESMDLIWLISSFKLSVMTCLLLSAQPASAPMANTKRPLATSAPRTFFSFIP